MELYSPRIWLHGVGRASVNFALSQRTRYDRLAIYSRREKNGRQNSQLLREKQHTSLRKLIPLPSSAETVETLPGLKL
jgi:hypothetical protein